MTILRPHKHRDLARFFAILFGILLAGGGVYIFEYNAFVGARQELTRLRGALAEAQSANADLKNQLYEAIDPAHLKPLAVARGLVLERQPAYLGEREWLSDSSSSR